MVSRAILLCASVACLTFSAGGLFISCKGAESPVESGLAEAGVAAAPGLCTLIENVTGTQANPVVETICANAGEIATIVATVIALADKSDAGVCKIIPTTNVCATPAQLHEGIASVVRERRARFLIDAGLQ